MFQYRIKDLMIVNAVLAISLVIAIAVSSFIRPLLTVLAVLIVLAVVIIGPIAWVETYLYRKQRGIWYRSMNPRKPRPRYVPMTDLPPYVPRESVEDEPLSKGRSRTRLFETGTASEPVTRASLLFNVASQLETSGRMEAAAEIYRQILDHFGDTAEAREAAHRLDSRSNKKTPVDR
jgi:hypothetical protein